MRARKEQTRSLHFGHFWILSGGAFCSIPRWASLNSMAQPDEALSPFEAHLGVFFISSGLSLNCPPQPGARGKRRSRSKNGIALWGQPLEMQDKRKGSRSKRLKPIERRRLPRSGRAKERPFFGSFFGRAKKEHTPRPGAKTEAGQD
jgi:hypothetical protein